ncbi:hypothetical protein [Oleiharenicola lentus]|uniref:hypothetical protein n=1 Tax=Oleiharenicola lentus TaxID=2508720 RepID=UPI003F66A8C1
MINKLGLVLECAREGADEKVMTCLARRLTPGTRLARPACMASKELLMNNGAEAAEQLLNAERCDRVFVVWDLKPAWEEEQQLLTCAEEIALMEEKLTALSIHSRVDLFCITHMLETWVIADDRAVSAHLSRPTRPYTFRRVTNPESHLDPKALLNACFSECRRGVYRDHTDAVRIIQKTPDTTRLRRAPTFTALLHKLTGNAATDFHHCGDVCNDLSRSGNFQPAQAPVAARPSEPVVVARRGRPRR